MKQDLTEMVFILDRSGSMSGLESDTIGGFNAMIEKQKKLEGEAYISTVLFNNHSVVLHDRIPVQKIEPLTENDYSPSGCTALIDALGGAIKHISNAHKYAREEDVPAKTMFVVMTDGLENASHQYSADEVRDMVKEKQEKNGWEFLFLGANIDAVETARHYGIRADRSVNFHADRLGVQNSMEFVTEAAMCMRMDAPISADWKEKAERDYKNRKKSR